MGIKVLVKQVTQLTLNKRQPKGNSIMDNPYMGIQHTGQRQTKLKKTQHRKIINGQHGQNEK
jgi:hypothetical protein